MYPKAVFVELGDDGTACRIFKNLKAAVVSGTLYTAMAKSTAVSQIRMNIWNRDTRTCTHCGELVSWAALEMHERIWKGRGGEVSVDNGTCLCHTCHADDPVAGHGKRKVQWSK